MGLFSFIGDAFNDIFGGNSSRKDSQKYNLENMSIQQDYALQNMAIQNQYNIDAFNRENEYNTPLAQQQRARVAGLNPVWTSSGQAIAQQDSVAQGSSPSGGMPSGQNTDVLGDVVNLLSVGANIRKTKADAKLAEENAKFIDTQNRAQEFALELDKEYRSPERAKALEEQDSRISVNTASADKTAKEAEQVFGLAWADISEKLSNIDLNDSKKKEIETLLDGRLKELFANISNLYASAFKSQVETQYIPIHYSQEQQKIQLQKEANQIQWKLAESLSSLQHATAQNLNAQTIGQKLANGLQSWAFENGWSQREFRNRVDKIGAEIYNEWNEYHKEHPNARFGQFLDNAIDLTQNIILRALGLESESPTRTLQNRGNRIFGDRGNTQRW